MLLLYYRHTLILECKYMTNFYLSKKIISLIKEKTYIYVECYYK